MATDVKNDASLSTSLVSYWELEETTGTRVDSHGSNDLTEVNSVASATGIQGTGADVERDNSEYLYAADTAALRPNNNFSISFWVKPESLTSNDSFVINKSELDTAMNYRIFISSTGAVQFFTRTTSNQIITTAASKVSAGSRAHIVCVKRSSGIGMEIYVNAVSSATGGSTANTQTATDPLMIGCRRKPATAEGFYDGVIDEVGFWNKVLSTTEISALYNSGAGIPYDASAGAAAKNPLFFGSGL